MSQKIKLIVDLLKQTTSIKVVSDFLKGKNLKHSASSWDFLCEKRIIPAINNNDLAEGDLIRLLSEVEEVGKQHILLYKCSTETAAELMEQKQVLAIADKAGLKGVTVNPAILDQPHEATISDIRWEPSHGGLCLVIKVIGTHTYERQIEEESEGKYFTRKFERYSERAVNVFRLHSDGLLECRVASHRGGSKYYAEVRRIWNKLGGFFPEDKFRDLSLSTAKNRLWDQREKLSDLVRFSDTTLKNDNGTTLKAITGSPSSDLYDDEAAASSMKEFFEHDAYCDSSNLWFKQNDKLSKDIHVLMSGELNEFAVTAQCNLNDYGYVLGQIRTFNS